MVLRVLRLLLGAALAVGCAAKGGAVEGALDGTGWILNELDGVPPSGGPAPTLHFDSGSVNGSDGCNRYSGPYRATGERFELAGQLVTTQMACPEPVMQRAQRYLSVLAQARRARVESDRLVLSDANGARLAAFSAQARTLSDTTWQVTGYNNGRQAVTSVLAGSTLTIAFGRDERVSGFAGCNRFTGAITGALPEVHIGAVGATRMMCADAAVMEQERAFLAALGRVVQGRLDGDRLELRSADGALQVAARASAAEAPSGLESTVRGGVEPIAELQLPATFRGDLPCADCEAIRTQLDLWPDHVFHLHRRWLGTTVERDVVGRWSAEPGRNVITLDVADGGPSQYTIVNGRALRQLDLAGQPIVSSLPYELVSDGTFAPADLSLTLSGEMRYMADAARFVECRTGRSYPMAMEGDFRALERAYVTAVREAGAELYVTFEGTIASRPKLDGDGSEPTVVVRRFVGVSPNRRC